MAAVRLTWRRPPRGQIQILNAREPITKVLADPGTPAELKQRLEQVRAAREFASRELGLPDNKSYTSYADLKREYVVWSVVATPEFSVEPREWCFPIVGCVAYRGYFKEAKAREFADRLRGEGFDTIVERGAGLFDARQVQRPHPEHHDDLRRR